MTGAQVKKDLDEALGGSGSIILVGTRARDAFSRLLCKEIDLSWKKGTLDPGFLKESIRDDLSESKGWVGTYKGVPVYTFPSVLNDGGDSFWEA